MNKKGEAFQLLISLATSVAVLVVITVVTFLILANGRQQINSIEGNETVGYNATITLGQTVSDGIPAFMPIIIFTGIGAVLIGLVYLFKRT